MGQVSTLEGTRLQPNVERQGKLDPRILSVATANPPRRFTQQEVLRLAGYTKPVARKIFFNSDIDTRYLFFDPDHDTTSETLDSLHQRYREGAVLLAHQAAKRCLEEAGLAPCDVDCILVSSCTGYLCPDLATILVKEMRLPDHVQRGSLLGLGCAGALPGLQRASDHARAYDDHIVLFIAVEICSAAYYIDDTMETMVGNAICADGAAACLITSRQGLKENQRSPRIAGFASVIDPNCQSSVGFEQLGGRLRIILSPTIRDLAPPMVERVIDRLLPDHALTREQINHWILHPGGRKVIDCLQAKLGLSDDDVATTRHILRNYGNMSSPTVLYVLREVMAKGVRPGDRGVMIALGPGFAAEGALLEW